MSSKKIWDNKLYKIKIPKEVNQKEKAFCQLKHGFEPQLARCFQKQYYVPNVQTYHQYVPQQGNSNDVIVS